jgi:transposase InsO family protein
MPPREGVELTKAATPLSEALMHANARLTPRGRSTLIERIQTGRPVAHVAAEMGISRATAYKWWARFRHEGWVGLQDRSSRPRHCPHQTPRLVEHRIESLRRSRKLGPARIGGIVGMAPSTVHRVLCRLGLSRLRWMDRPSGRVIRRMVMTRPGELVHVDIKKLGRIPDGGGWRAIGRQAARPGRDLRRTGYAFIHAAIDGYSRVAYAEVLNDERGVTAAGFWTRAQHWFADRGVTVERVLTDNGACYRSHDFTDALGEATHTFTRPYRPQTNGKVERFNRTLLDEWAYVRVYQSETQRTHQLHRWLHLYNHHRSHTSLGGQAPIETLSNLPGQYT